MAAQGWADLPQDVLELVLAAAQRLPPSPPAGAPAASLADARPPSLRAAAQLAFAVEASCRSWRATAAAARSRLPISLTLGATPLPPDAATALPAWLGHRHLATLHVESHNGPANCSPYVMQHLALSLLASPEVQAASGGSLHELVVRNFLSSRPLCSALPRFRALRRLALTGYLADLDPAPLAQLPALEQLHLEAEALPSLAALPATLRTLSLSCFAHAARLALPTHLHLDSLICSCPSQSMYVGLDRVLSQCRSVHLVGQHIRLQLKVDLALHASGASAALERSFRRHARVQQLLLEVPVGRLYATMRALGPEGDSFDSGRIHPEAVCEFAAAHGGGAVLAEVVAASSALQPTLAPQGLLLRKQPPRAG